MVWVVLGLYGVGSQCNIIVEARIRVASGLML